MDLILQLLAPTLPASAALAPQWPKEKPKMKRWRRYCRQRVSL